MSAFRVGGGSLQGSSRWRQIAGIPHQKSDSIVFANPKTRGEA
jgi:hypothetical protein